MTRLNRNLLIVGVPIAISLAILLFFDNSGTIFSVMSIAFILFLPLLVGVLTIKFSREEKTKSIGYRICMPWLPIISFFFFTLILYLEGWACWIIVLPVFFVMSSIGGLIAGHFRHKSDKIDRLQVPVAILLPFLVAPIEHAICPNPALYTAYTEITIQASAATIWDNVARVREIDEQEDTGWLSRSLGVPRPVEAVLNYEGVGTERKAIFTGGLVFDETVTEYREQEYMSFSIVPNTGEIPSTTFDEHILIGGEYFDVLEGTYELEKVDDQRYKLKLWSEFELNTTFNIYSGLWGRWIMKDIQKNILRVIKSRSESGK